MKFKIAFLFVTISCFYNCKNKEENKVIADSEVIAKTIENTVLQIHPIEHASAVVKFGSTTIYIDPTLGAEPYKRFNKPDYVVITDIHGDHMNIKTLKALDFKETKIIAPKAVVDQLPEEMKLQSVTLNNGNIESFTSFKIEAVPMYNLREKALKFHTKGRGNGYIFTFGNERVYFSGDTEDIPEMRALKNIDKAFICMNLPYTMTVENAASAVIKFKPKQVYPYHYRGTEGLSDVAKFKSLVNESSPKIEVIQLDWHPSLSI